MPTATPDFIAATLQNSPADARTTPALAFSFALRLDVDQIPLAPSMPSGQSKGPDAQLMSPLAPMRSLELVKQS